MALETVTVTWAVEDAARAQDPGTVTFTLSETVTDTATGTVISPSPSRAYPYAGGTGSSDPLVANDSPSLDPQGTYYVVTVATQGHTWSCNVVISAANGAVQTLGGLMSNPAQPDSQYYSYLKLPSGTPAAGDVPVATGTGTQTAWQAQSGGGSGGAVTPSWDPYGTYTVAFHDDFNGTALNGAYWGAGWQAAAGVTGPVNASETAAYSSANVSVSGSCLRLALTATSSKSGYPNTGACVTTNPNGTGGTSGFSFTYGAAEARIWVPPSPGGGQIANWPAWWLDGQSWPADGEIDIMEGLSGQAQQHFHFANTAGTAESQGGNALAPDPAGSYTGWHTFGMNWTATQIDYYYDGQLVRTITGGITGQPMYLILNNTTSASVGGPTVTGDAGTMLVDWVRVWSPGTPAPLSAAGALADSFEDPGTLSTRWGGGYPAEITIRGGRAVITSAADYPAIQSGRPCSLEGSAAWAQVTPAQSADCQTRMSLISGVTMAGGGSENQAAWNHDQAAGTLTAAITQAATVTSLAALTYSPRQHAWWRIRESGGTIYWDTSPDGAAWTQQASSAYAAAFPAGRLYLSFQAGCWGTAVTDATVIQNLNASPPGRFTTVLPAAWTSANGTSAQAVTGMSAYLPADTYKVRAWAPVLPAGTTGSTQTLAWTFSGTAAAVLASWRCAGGSSSTWAQSATLTTGFTTPTMTAAGFEVTWEAHVRVTAPGTLQLTTTPGTSGDNVQFPAGCSVEACPAVF